MTTLSQCLTTTKTDSFSCYEPTVGCLCGSLPWEAFTWNTASSAAPRQGIISKDSLILKVFFCKWQPFHWPEQVTCPSCILIAQQRMIFLQGPAVNIWEPQYSLLLYTNRTYLAILNSRSTVKFSYFNSH